MPQPEKQLDVIKVTGLVANVERAKLGLLERVKELQAEQEDRVHTHTRTHLLSVLDLLLAVEAHRYIQAVCVLTECGWERDESGKDTSPEVCKVSERF